MNLTLHPLGPPLLVMSEAEQSRMLWLSAKTAVPAHVAALFAALKLFPGRVLLVITFPQRAHVTVQLNLL